MKLIYPTIIYLMCAGILHAQPRFVPDVEIRKLGEVVFQHPKRVVFGFTNKGNQPLVITSAKPSCGCMDVTFPTARAVKSPWSLTPPSWEPSIRKWRSSPMPPRPPSI